VRKLYHTTWFVPILILALTFFATFTKAAETAPILKAVHSATFTKIADTIDVSGRYQCASAKVAGKVIKCTAAPLTLRHDGRFELRGWEGTYLVDGDWVEMSDSLIRARAKIEKGHKITLRYYGKHGLVEMTFERRVAELGNRSLS
jgi:hypothetical protein